MGGVNVIDVCLLGCGGMLPLPNRALTSLYVKHNGHALLIDCGEGTQTALKAAGQKSKPIDVILITHVHADHIAGLPGLLLTMGNDGRTAPVTIYGPEGLTEIVRSLCVIAPEVTFPVNVCEISGAHMRFKCIGLTVDAFALEHRLPCYGYCFTLERKGKFNINRAKELGVPVSAWKRLQRGECAEGFAPEDVMGEVRKGIKLLYATDTRPVSGIAEYGAAADLMILEGIFGAAEKQARAEETCHMMMWEAAELAKEANAEELWLTHFSPATYHPEEYEAAIGEIFPQVVMGKDGLRKTLQFQT